MNTLERIGRSWTAKIAIAVGAGLVVLVLLFPASGNSREPPECSSVFGYTVACDAGLAVAAGAVTAGAVALLLWISDRRHPE
jgi:multisubunit Na+/H+ antiporter MnhB subunit